MEEEGLAARAELLLDPRLAEVWQLVWAGGPDADEPGEAADPGVSEPMLACLLRLAYLQGYADATAEPEPGALYRELGVRDPVARERTERRRAVRPGRRSSGR
jgi:hypothetical protein